MAQYFRSLKVRTATVDIYIHLAGRKEKIRLGDVLGVLAGKINGRMMTVRVPGG